MVQIRFSQVQLEEGTVATSFEHRPIALELALCQRYYEKTDGYNIFVTVTRWRFFSCINSLSMLKKKKYQ